MPAAASAGAVERDELYGKQLGAFMVEHIIGTGGMGKVYSARVSGKAPGLESGCRVALKVVHPHLLETPGFFKRFMREADIGKAVQHDNVVRTVDCDQIVVDGVSRNFLVMEYVEGQTLRDLQRELERVPEELCRHIAHEVVQGLVAIHAAKVIHRDLKPENVLITPDHQIKVMDLGIARLQDEAMRLSVTGHFVGSMQYAAPEQFSEADDAVCQATDLHALGVLLYELASGQCPYAGDDMKQLIHQITSVEPKRLGDLNPQLSPFFEEVVHTLLAKQVADRFLSAEALLDVLISGTESEWWHEREPFLREETAQPLRRIRIPRDTAVYGRDEELVRLGALYERAATGEGQVLLLEGEAGIGKSRLVDEFVGQLRETGADLNFLFGSYPPGGAATSLGAFSSAYREQVGEAGCAALLRSTPLLVPAFDALLRGDTAPTDCVPLTKESLQTCFVHATRALAEQRPTIVLIEDLHFAPEEGRALFASLGLAIGEQPVILIGTLRPGQVSQEWLSGVQRLEHVTRLELQRLGARDLARLLEDVFRSKRLAEELGVKIGLKSDGNPFFVFEILRGMREGQFITQQPDGTWVGTQVIEDIEIPSTVMDLVNARVADLTEDQRNLLDVAACWGFEFDPLLIGEVLGIPRIPVLRQLSLLEREHRLVRSAGRAFVFDHHQVQEALYGGLPELLREEYHAALADALVARTNAAQRDPETLDGKLCVDLCEHYLKGARGEDALRYLHAAQEHLRSGYLYHQFVTLTDGALAAPGLLIGLDRAKTLLTMTPLSIRGDRERHRECAEESKRLAEEAGDESVRARAALAVGKCCGRLSRLEEAGENFQLALDIALSLGDQRTESDSALGLAVLFAEQGRLSEAIEYSERSLAVARAAGDREREAGALGDLGLMLKHTGRLPEAREIIEQAIAIFDELGVRAGVARNSGNLGIVCSQESRLAEAREHYQRSLELGCEVGDRGIEASALLNLGNLLYREWRLVEAQEYYERCLSISREIGYSPGQAQALLSLGASWHRLGDCSQSRELRELGLAQAREIRSRELHALGLLALGRLSFDEGRGSAIALRLCEEALELFRESGYSYGIVDALTEIGDLHRGAGDMELARSALNEAVTTSQTQGMMAREVLATSLLACLPGADTEAAVSAVSELGEGEDAMRVRWLLYTATGERVHLEAAKRHLDEQLSKVPSEYHESICTNLDVQRRVLVEWRGLDRGNRNPDAG